MRARSNRVLKKGDCLEFSFYDGVNLRNRTFYITLEAKTRRTMSVIDEGILHDVLVFSPEGKVSVITIHEKELMGEVVYLSRRVVIRSC